MFSFFPSNARWLSPGRLSSRKDNCIVQIHRINAIATLVISALMAGEEVFPSGASQRFGVANTMVKAVEQARTLMS
jgi:hypothetical protein